MSVLAADGVYSGDDNFSGRKKKKKSKKMKDKSGGGGMPPMGGGGGGWGYAGDVEHHREYSPQMPDFMMNPFDRPASEQVSQILHLSLLSQNDIRIN